MFRRLAPAVAAAAVLAAVPAAASADPGIGEPTSLRVAFTTKHPDRSTGLRLRTTGAPPVAPTTIAPAVQQTLELPRGTRLRLDALPRCMVDEATLAAVGAEMACPVETRLGTGRAEGLANGAPVGFDLTIFAIGGRLFFAGSQNGVPLKTGFYGAAQGRRLVLTVPTRGVIAPTLFQADVRRDQHGSAWLQTPPKCPHSGHWTARSTFQVPTAVDGGTPVGESRTVADDIACQRR
jgi:hypothetical protein